MFIAFINVRDDIVRALENHTEGHRKRLRTRLLRHGIAALQDYEKLELLLMFVLPRRDTKPLAKEMIQEHQSLRNVMILAGQHQEFLSERFQVLTKLCVHNEWLSNTGEKRFAAAQDVARYVQPMMKNLLHEQVRALCVDGQGVLLYELVQDSALSDHAGVAITDLVRVGVQYKAIALIIAHNHPSGDPTPSVADKVFTQKLANACEAVGLILADHLVVGRESVCSVIVE